MITDVEPDVTALIVRNTRMIKVINAVASSATPAFDASLADHHTMTMTAAVTSSTITNPTLGQVIVIDFLNDGTGHTIAWPSNTKWGTGVTTGTTVGAGAPNATGSPVASKHTTATLRYDGTNWLELSRSIDVG